MPEDPSGFNVRLLTDREACLRLRDALDKCRYTERELGEMLHESEMPKRVGHALPRLLWATRTGAPSDTLIRLFLLNLPVEADAIRVALQPADPDHWVRAGLFVPEGSCYRSTLRLTPFQDLLIGADPNDLVATGGRPDFVLPITASALVLICCVVSTRPKRAVDIGSGSGVISFAAARQSEHVTGVDCNPRAVAVSRFNAALNRFGNVEFTQGDGFQPVEGQTFDLIVSNPPFMISPSVRYVFRDSGSSGDSFVLNLARRAADLLENGGFAQILGDFIDTETATAEERLNRWFAGSGCDVWYLKLGTKEPEKYAGHWLEATEPADLKDPRRLFQEWMDYYAASGIRSITTGLLNLRKAPNKRNWFHYDEIPEEKTTSLGDHIVQRFTVGDFLEDMDDEGLLAAPLRVAPDLRLIQECEAAPGTWRVVQSELKLAGLPFRGLADRYSVGLLARVDGKRTVRSLLEELAKAAGVDFHQVRAGGIQVIRDLIERGYLLPVQQTVQ